MKLAYHHSMLRERESEREREQNVHSKKSYLKKLNHLCLSLSTAHWSKRVNNVTEEITMLWLIQKCHLWSLDVASSYKKYISFWGIRQWMWVKHLFSIWQYLVGFTLTIFLSCFLSFFLASLTVFASLFFLMSFLFFSYLLSIF